MQQLSKVFGFRTCLCLLLQALGLQAHAAESPRTSVDANTLQSMLSTQQLRVFLREDLRMEWSVTRLPEAHPDDESELSLALAWRLKFK